MGFCNLQVRLFGNLMYISQGKNLFKIGIIIKCDLATYRWDLVFGNFGIFLFTSKSIHSNNCWTRSRLPWAMSILLYSLLIIDRRKVFFIMDSIFLEVPEFFSEYNFLYVFRENFGLEMSIFLGWPMSMIIA